MLQGDESGYVQSILDDFERDEAEGKTWGLYDGSRLVETHSARYRAEAARADLADMLDRDPSTFDIREVADA
jgi:hypothetical protein